MISIICAFFVCFGILPHFPLTLAEDSDTCIARSSNAPGCLSSGLGIKFFLKEQASYGINLSLIGKKLPGRMERDTRLIFATALEEFLQSSFQDACPSIDTVEYNQAVVTDQTLENYYFYPSSSPSKSFEPTVSTPPTGSPTNQQKCPA